MKERETKTLVVYLVEVYLDKMECLVQVINLRVRIKQSQFSLHTLQMLTHGQHKTRT
jgi:hypothetical protein